MLRAAEEVNVSKPLRELAAIEAKERAERRIARLLDDSKLPSEKSRFVYADTALFPRFRIIAHQQFLGQMKEIPDWDSMW